MDEEIHFVQGLACVEKLKGTFRVTGYPRVQVNAFLVLQRICNRFLNKLLAQQGHLFNYNYS